MTLFIFACGIFYGVALAAIVTGVVLLCTETSHPPGHPEAEATVRASREATGLQSTSAPEVAETALLERCTREVLLVELERADGALRWLTDIRTYRRNRRLQ